MHTHASSPLPLQLEDIDLNAFNSNHGFKSLWGEALHYKKAAALKNAVHAALTTGALKAGCHSCFTHPPRMSPSRSSTARSRTPTCSPSSCGRNPPVSFLRPTHPAAGCPSAGIHVPLCAALGGGKMRKVTPSTLQQLEGMSRTLSCLDIPWEQFCPFTTYAG